MRRTLTLALVLTGLFLVGCSEDDPPPALPTPSPAPTVGAFAESDDTEPTAEPEPETAKEFIRRWPVVETAMLNTGDSSGYRAISTDCSECQGIADRVDAIYDNGGYIKTRGWTVEDTKRQGPASNEELQLVVRTFAQPTRYQEKAGGPKKRYAGGPITYRVAIKRTTEGWQLASVTELSQ